MAKDGLSHAVPNATTEQVLQAALRLLLEKQARARGLVKRPRKTVPVTLPASPGPHATEPSAVAPGARAATSRAAKAQASEPTPPRREGRREAIPAAVKRAVWQRDGGRCSWPLDGGGRCGSTHRLELDHIVPWAQGGEDTASNLRVVCHRHNALAARRAFGERMMARCGGVREPVAEYGASPSGEALERWAAGTGQRPGRPEGRPISLKAARLGARSLTPSKPAPPPPPAPSPLPPAPSCAGRCRRAARSPRPA